MITLSGPGVLYGVPAAGNGTPCNFGKIKQCTLDFTRSVKPITGGQVWPFDFAGGSIKGTGKAKMAAVSPLALAALFFGVTPGTGQTLTQYLEAGAIPATTPFTVTVSQAATFVEPLEVLYAATGLPLTQVASGPVAGQYSVAAGVFTFAAADEGKGVLISYTYTGAAGNNVTVNNALQGDVPIFSAVFYNKKNGKPVTIMLPMLASEKLALDFKEDAAVEPEIDFLIGANAAGQAIVYNFPELS